MGNGFTALDCPKSLMDFGGALNAQGITDVWRYVMTEPETEVKDRLTKAEYEHLVGMGINVHVVWENRFPNFPGYFTSQQGADDGEFFADYCANELVLPVESILWMVADYDSAPYDISLYFRNAQFKVKFERAHSDGTVGRYQLGMYGSGNSLQVLKAWGIISHTWLAGSTGWSGYQEYKNLANVVQTINGENFEGLGVDWNTISTLNRL